MVQLPWFDLWRILISLKFHFPSIKFIQFVPLSKHRIENFLDQDIRVCQDLHKDIGQDPIGEIVGLPPGDPDNCQINNDSLL
jgi:hypothetical protein